jgi:hypothetical protein
VSLRRRERRVLREIEAGICRSDPGLAQLLGGFRELTVGQAMPADERGRGSAALAVAASAARLAGHAATAAAAAICTPGLRERLGVRERPHPMARSGRPYST